MKEPDTYTKKNLKVRLYPMLLQLPPGDVMNMNLILRLVVRLMAPSLSLTYRHPFFASK